jgi:hypothetical protein
MNQLTEKYNTLSTIDLLKNDFKQKIMDFYASSGNHKTIDTLPDLFSEVEVLPSNINNLTTFNITVEIHTAKYNKYISPFNDFNLIHGLNKNGFFNIQIFAKNYEELLEKCQHLQYFTTCLNFQIFYWCRVNKIEIKK